MAIWNNLQEAEYRNARLAQQEAYKNEPFDVIKRVGGGAVYFPENQPRSTDEGILTSDLLKTQPDLSKQLTFANPNQDLFPVGSLNVEVPQAQPTVLEAKADVLSERLQRINEQLLGQEALRTEKEKEAGIPELQRTQSELAGRVKQLQAEALAIPLQLQAEATGRGITAAGLAPLQTARLRENAIQALSTSALFEASRGNLLTAQSLVERAVQQKFAPLEEEKRALIANLELIQKSPAYTLAQQNRAAKQKALEEANLRNIEKQKTEEKEVKDTANLAIKYGLTNPLLIKQISESKTALEAKQKAAPYLQDPKAKMELEQTRLENILKQKQIEKIEREIAGVGIPSPKETAKEEAQRIAAREAIPVAQDKLNLINKIISHPSLSKAVGPIGLVRAGVFGALGGGKADFIADVNLLIQKETLDTLINLKKAGGTLGALSEGEARMLREAASKIGSWVVKDGDGNTLGFKANEKSFIAEMNRLKDLANRALARAAEGGKIIGTDEKSALDEFFSESTPTSTINFSPAGYF